MRGRFYTNGLNSYVNRHYFVIPQNAFLSLNTLYNARWLRHASFWLLYYLAFSLIWASPDRGGYFASFYLEFVLMPLRILASYCMMYVLIPAFLNHRRLTIFLFNYGCLIVGAGGLQLLIGHYFYDQLVANGSENFQLNLAAWLRNIVLINTTVILLGAAKIVQLHFALVDSLASSPDEVRDNEPAETVIEVRSNRRVHRLRVNDILFIEGMGNYIRYVTAQNTRIVVYGSLKAAQELLPGFFVRAHRSYLVNTEHISAYDSDTITIGNHTLPRGKELSDAQIQASTKAQSI